MKQRNNEQENYMIKPQEFQPLPCLLNYVVTPKMQSVKFLWTKDPNIMVDSIIGFSMLTFTMIYCSLL
jgi:hypothetical protein